MSAVPALSMQGKMEKTGDVLHCLGCEEENESCVCVCFSFIVRFLHVFHFLIPGFIYEVKSLPAFKDFVLYLLFYAD